MRPGFGDSGPVLVTGAAGFIGHALTAHFRATGRACRATAHTVTGDAVLHRDVGGLLPLDLETAGDEALADLVAGASAVVHLAGRAHVRAEAPGDVDARYRDANVAPTVRLARAAREAGVRRFVFASSVKVNGEASMPGRAFTPHDPPAPQDAYARSKRDAERALVATCAGAAIAPIVLRLPLVYGPGVKANFLALIDEVARERRLPLAAVRNRRSLLYLGNLVGAIEAALDSPAAPAGVHFIADARSVSVPELVTALAQALAVSARMTAVPVPLLALGGRLLGKGAVVARLTGSLEVDSASFTAATGWHPHATLAEGLAATAAWWRGRHAI